MVSTDPFIGQQLANYRIEKLIGRGGMGKVYLGWDVRLHRSVAVKVIDELLKGDPNYTERFLREARIMATWQHMNIPLVYNVGEYEGVLFYAMEYIRGQTLSQLLRQVDELLPEVEVLRIGWAIANALDYAHQKGVIHRDVTPSNVILSEDGRVVLMDFGLALDMVQGTQGEVFGSPHYIAPEQASNSAGAVMQTDFYSLGVMLYEMLTGAVPFDDPSPITLALKHITEEPPSPREINPQINPEVEMVLLKALHKKASERYQSGKELMDALEGALRRGEIESQPATLPEIPGYTDDAIPTLAEIPVGQTPDPKLASLPPLGDIPAEKGPKPSSARSRYLAFGGLGCGLLILIGFVLLVGGVSLVLSHQNPSSQITQIGSIPRVTRAPTQTRAVVNRPSPSSTSNPTATGVATLTQTPPIQLIYELLFVGHKDDSLFVVNQGALRFPLAPLEFKNKAGELSGEEWGVDFLESGECVTLWKKEGQPQAPKDIECDEVGQRLERSASDKFWNERFEIYYQGKKIGSCETSKVVCSIKMTEIER